MSEILIALITPFNQNKEVDYQAISCMIEQYISEGVNGFIICGTTGETPTLSIEERFKILKIVVDCVNNRVKIWYGCGTNCTDETIRRCRMLEQFKIEGVLLALPYYNKPNQRGVYEHFAAIASSIQQNIMLYNIPSRCSITLEEKTCLKLIQEFPNIVALKQASLDFSIAKAIKRVRADFKVYSGEDAYFHQAIDAGMDGVISVMAHVGLKEMHEYLIKRKPYDELSEELKALAELTFCEPSPAPIKYMLSLLGKCQNHLRLPMVSTSIEKNKLIEKFILK